jgi:hypothetical protein
MRVLAPVVQIPTLAMLSSWEHLALGRAVALQLVRDDDAGNVHETLEQLAKKLLGGLLVAPALRQHIQDMTVLIHSPPQVMALAVDRQQQLIHVPCVPRLRATATQPIGVLLPTLPTPWADSFVGHGDAACAQEFLHVAVAQGEAIGEPDAMTDDGTGKAVMRIALGVGGRGHVRLPILGCNESSKGQRRGRLCHGSGKMVNKLTIACLI